MMLRKGTLGRLVNRTGVLALAMLLGTTIAGCGGPGGQVLGDLLSSLTSQVDTIITTAGNTANGLLASAAAEVQQAIDNASSAYQDDLSKTVTSLQGVEATTVAQLQVLVQDLSSSVQQILQQATLSAQQIVLSLPFANHAPQVTSYSPRFVAHPQSTGTTQITVNGVFFYADQSQYAPTLTLPGQSTPLKAREVSTQQLEFDVPNSVFAAPVPGQFGDVSLGLSLPFPTTKDVIFHKIVPGNFQLLVTTLPSSPVQSLTLTNTTTSTHTVFQSVSKPPAGWHQQSNQDCTTKANVPYTAYPDSGWTVDTGVVPTITYLQNKSPGAQQVTINTYTSSAIVIAATTEAECFLGISNGSGDITFQVTFTEEMTVSTSQTGTQMISINWGDKLIYSIQPGWTLTAKLFNGETLDFANADNTNPYLTVTLPAATSIAIAAPSPDQVSSIS